MNPDRTPKTRSVGPTLWIKIARQKVEREWAFSGQLNLTALGMLVSFSSAIIIITIGTILQ